MEAEYGGSLPRDPLLGPANVTWIIAWTNKAVCDVAWTVFRQDPGWVAILAQVPGGRISYLRTEVRFATEI